MWRLRRVVRVEMKFVRKSAECRNADACLDTIEIRLGNAFLNMNAMGQHRRRLLYQQEALNVRLFRAFFESKEHFENYEILKKYLL